MSVRLGSDWAGGLKVGEDGEGSGDLLNDKKGLVHAFLKRTTSNLWRCRSSLSLGFGQQ